MSHVQRSAGATLRNWFRFHLAKAGSLLFLLTCRWQAATGVLLPALLAVFLQNCGHHRYTWLAAPCFLWDWALNSGYQVSEASVCSWVILPAQEQGVTSTPIASSVFTKGHDPGHFSIRTVCISLAFKHTSRLNIVWKPWLHIWSCQHQREVECFKPVV